MGIFDVLVVLGIFGGIIFIVWRKVEKKYPEAKEIFSEGLQVKQSKQPMEITQQVYDEKRTMM